MRGDRIFGKISVRESKGVLILTLIIVALQGAALLYGEWERSRRPSGVESDMSQSIATSSHLPKKESPKTKYESRRENLSQRRVVVELNSSDSATLLSVPGIGPYFASAILKLREELGGFVSHRQLLEIRGIDSTKLGELLPHIVVDPSQIERKSISAASFQELSNNPQIGAYRARAILKLKELLVGEEITLKKIRLHKIIGEELEKFLNFYYK